MKNKTEKIYKIFIIPSSDDERAFEECDTYNEAIKLSAKLRNTTGSSGEEFIFNSERERELFIQGYKSGVGFMGDGLFYIT